MIAISACIAGVPCRFDGTNQDLVEALALEKYGHIIKICPEVLGGLTTPRAPAEIRFVDNKARVISNEGLDVTKEFQVGAGKALEICKENNVRYVILKDRSPSCGKGRIYNGKFEGKLIEGNGLTSDLLMEHNIQVYNSSHAPYKKLMVYDFLDENNISFEKITHQPIFTVEEAKSLQINMNGQECKNLFLETKNKKVRMLVILPFNQKFRFKEVEEALGIKNLKFASKETLKKYLGVDPGSVGAFGLLYDLERQVQVLVSSQIDTSKRITFHPNINDETLSISYNGFTKMLQVLGYKPMILDV